MGFNFGTMGRTNNIMRYKIIGDVNISGNVEGDYFEAEQHAVALYLERGQIEEIKGNKDAKPKRIRKVVSKK
jgi:hypothetical protein